jgi:hypothetical protein
MKFQQNDITRVEMTQKEGRISLKMTLRADLLPSALADYGIVIYRPVPRVPRGQLQRQ